MKYIEMSEHEVPMVELTERNLRALLDKLDDPNSKRTIIDGEHKIAVKAVPDEAHYGDRAPGLMLTKGVLT